MRRGVGGGPVGIRVRAKYALHIGHGGPLESARARPAPREIEGVDVAVGGEHRGELGDRPVSRFTAPPGTSEVASTSARVIAGSGPSRSRGGPRVFPVTSTGASTLTRPEERGGLRRQDADDAGRLGHAEVEERAGDRIGGPDDLGQLVRPAGIPDPAVDGGIDARRGLVVGNPSLAATSSANWARRPSSISATR